MQNFCDTCGAPCGRLKYCSSDCRPGSREYRQRIRDEFYQAYGGKCQCPGGCDVTEPRFMSLDHIGGGGDRHRKLTGKSGWQMYQMLRELGWPTDKYRMLCLNCNLSAGFYGRCPHEDKVSQAQSSAVTPRFWEGR